MWDIILFPIGLIGFLIFIYVAKLYKVKGTKFKTRAGYFSAVSLFFTLLMLLRTEGDMKIIGKGVLLGIVLSAPYYLSSRRWLKNTIQGPTIYYKRGQQLKSFIWLILFAIFLQILGHQAYMKQAFDAIWTSVWPLLGLAFAWFISQGYVLFYVIKIERELGSPILEDEK